MILLFFMLKTSLQKKTAIGSLFIFIIPNKKIVLVSSVKNGLHHEIHVIIVCECILNILG